MEEKKTAAELLQEKLLVKKTTVYDGYAKRSAEKAMQSWQAMSHAPFAAGSHLDLIMAARAAAMRDGAELYSEVTVHSVASSRVPEEA